MRPLTKLALLLALGFTGTTAAYASASFDGTWSVKLTTQKGHCDATYSWSVAVNDGRFVNGGSFMQAAGSIDPRGRVHLELTDGSDMLAAAGAVRGEVGHGTWLSPTMQCSGAWRAVRS
jgi:hypothetical protein